MHLKSNGKPDIASELDMLRQWRNQCDYEDQVAMLPAIAQAAVMKAQAILAALI